MKKTKIKGANINFILLLTITDSKKYTEALGEQYSRLPVYRRKLLFPYYNFFVIYMFHTY